MTAHGQVQEGHHAALLLEAQQFLLEGLQVVADIGTGGERAFPIQFFQGLVDDRGFAHGD